MCYGRGLWVVGHGLWVVCCFLVSSFSPTSLSLPTFIPSLSSLRPVAQSSLNVSVRSVETGLAALSHTVRPHLPSALHTGQRLRAECVDFPRLPAGALLGLLVALLVGLLSLLWVLGGRRAGRRGPAEPGGKGR